MLHLPTYADNKIGRALIAEIIDTRPEPRVCRHRLPSVYGGYSDGTTTSYPGKPAAMLRKLRREWVEREYALLDSQFAVTHIWDDDAAAAVLGCEQADALIARLTDLSKRFWQRVEKTEGCWLWTGSRQKCRPFESTGYGMFHLGSLKYVRATRMSVFLTTLEWPGHGMFVCHRCDNPACVRPDHLFIGTPSENARDMVQKGRAFTPICPSDLKARGTEHGSAKLTEQQVREIRAAKGKQRDIAVRYGINQAQVWRIKHKRTWAHVADAPLLGEAVEQQEAA